MTHKQLHPIHQNKYRPASHQPLIGELTEMPQEILDVEKFIETSERAEYCNIKRLRRTVKLKLRTPKKLMTLKVDPTKAEEIVKKLRCEIREV